MESSSATVVPYELEYLGYTTPDEQISALVAEGALRWVLPANRLEVEIEDYRSIRASLGRSARDGSDCVVLGKCTWKGHAQVCCNPDPTPPWMSAWVQNQRGEWEWLTDNPHILLSARLTAAGLDEVGKWGQRDREKQSLINDQASEIGNLKQEVEHLKEAVVNAEHARDTAEAERAVAAIGKAQAVRELEICRARIHPVDPPEVLEWPREAGVSDQTISPRLLVMSDGKLRGDYRLTLDDVFDGPTPMHTRHAFRVNINTNSGKWVHVAWRESDAPAAVLIAGTSRAFPRTHRFSPDELMKMITEVTGANFHLVDVKSAYERAWNVL